MVCAYLPLSLVGGLYAHICQEQEFLQKTVTNEKNLKDRQFKRVAPAIHSARGSKLNYFFSTLIASSRALD
jgi:hypothetical protein